jgi:hypothetical protein
MVANKATIAALLLILSTFVSANERQYGQDHIVSYLTGNLLSSVAQLGQTIEACDQLAESRAIPELDRGYLAKLNTSREELLIALSHLAYSNHFECTRQARLSMAYDLGVLLAVQRELGKLSTGLSNEQMDLAYPSAQAIRHEIMYEELSAEVRAYLKEAVGQEPFELLNTLQHNNLFQE